MKTYEATERAYRNGYEAGLKEIERYKGVIRLLEKDVQSEREEIERLKQILDSYALQYGTVKDQSERIKEIRDEAIKEFAERLKEKKQWDVDIPDYVFVTDIDTIAKELTEGKGD